MLVKYALCFLDAAELKTEPEEKDARSCLNSQLRTPHIETKTQPQLFQLAFFW